MQALIIFLLTTFHFTQSYSKNTVQRTNVLILGGGMAGVAAAHTLHAAGMRDFLLLEATGRLGGRVRETKFLSRTIEEGANWIHGVEKNNNPLVKLAQAANLKIFYTRDTDSIRARNSRSENVTNDFENSQRVLTRAERRMYNLVEENELTSDLSIKEGLKTLGKWTARTPADFAAEYYRFDFVDPMPPHKLSVMGHLNNKEEEIYGQEEALVVDQDGFAKIIRHLAAQTFTQNDARLHLSEMVSEVHFDLENDKNVPDGLPKEGVYVKTTMGNEYYARFCIITFTNAYLLSGKVKFQPKLPDWKVRALNQSETAVYNKLFVKFADNVKPFWDAAQFLVFVDSEPVSQANSGNIDSARLNSPAMEFARKWGEEFTRGYYTLWVNLATPGMFPGSNILLSVLVDDMAKKAELKSEAELKTELTSVLRRMYGAGVPEPEAVFCTKWFTDPLALGSFHSIRAGVTDEDLKNLKRGIRNLHFAGDGSDVAFIGLLQNAYLTGVEKAQLGLKELQWKSSSLSAYTLTPTNCILQFLMITKCLCILYNFLL